jgi:small GTP-binding protein
VIQKKICLLGAFGVGKTSLVSQFVHSLFSDKYLTTLGVKIEKKSVDLGSQQVDLILWDMHGEDDFQNVNVSYLRGAAGYLLVVDGTRRATVQTAISLHEVAERAVGPVPFRLLLNKADLVNDWEVDENILASLGWPILRTSAKTGAGVEQAFEDLARATVGV